MIFRLATPDDAAGILEIYGPYVRDTSITFETVVPSREEMAGRIGKYLEQWPWLVAEENGRIAGYAYASRYRERVAYQWSVECSVYIHNDSLRRGLARALYTGLFRLLQKQGYRNVYAVINLPNDRSVAFHESLGFRWFATYEQVGYKLGQWKNVGWWRLVINEFGPEPASVIPFSQLEKEELPPILDALPGLVNGG